MDVSCRLEAGKKETSSTSSAFLPALSVGSQCQIVRAGLVKIDRLSWGVHAGLAQTSCSPKRLAAFQGRRPNAHDKVFLSFKK
ncbi:MAG: hypothetical protein GY822_28425 [Deltaproteobacteria bacterium]|nr:hypothetical protein [Deltaproteobacteria bacterium]